MLKKLTIDNFKSLKRLEYDCAGLNLLAGMNGAGKSSFIQMMCFMQKISGKIGEPDFTISAKELGAELSSGDFRYCYANKGHDIGFSVDFATPSNPGKIYSLKKIIFDSILSNIKDGLIVQHPDYDGYYLDCYGESLGLQAEKADGGNVSQKEIDESVSRAMNEFSALEKKMRDEDRENAQEFSRLWHGVRFVDAFRLKPADVHVGGRYSEFAELGGDLSTETFDAEGQDVAEYLYKSQGCNNTNELLVKINACLEWVSPGARLSVKKQNVGGQEYFIESVGFGKAETERQYKPQNVGFGISYILPVLVTLLSAKPGSILIIENPEAHLHPRGQAEMGKLIAETVARGVQVFVETHSDHVINGTRVAVKRGIVKPEDVNIAFFERGSHDVPQEDGTTRREIYSEVTNIKVDANGSLSEWPRDFMDEWGIQQMKLLRP